MDHLSTAPYRGTRDFLPEEMSVRADIYSRLFRVVESYGYLRYDGPMLEPIELYEAKSGQELVDEQIYRLTDRGNRVLAIRPEMTPSVARMIAGRQQRLQFPVRWYSFVNCYRYERPQRGRLREHWQINVDIFGSQATEAEVEIFELIFALFAALGATASDFVLRVSDRALVGSALSRYVDLTDEQLHGVFRIVDGWEKRPVDQSRAALAALELSATQCERVEALVSLDLAGYADLLDAAALARSPIARILTQQMTAVPLVFDPLIVRGLDYYTSTVFEVFDIAPENRRAIFGGGRYDNLVALFSDRPVPGIGFALGDVTLFDFLATHGLLPAPRLGADAIVIPLSAEMQGASKAIAQELRTGGLRVVMPLESRTLTKELRDAARRGVRFAVIVSDEELSRGAVILRDLVRAEQEEIGRAALGDTMRTQLQAQSLQ